MRGCFRDTFIIHAPFIVLPAYAGMFLAIQRGPADADGSPRVCGDVSGSAVTTAKQLRFSPRMRGCFELQQYPAQPAAVLPAYAGMFPGDGVGLDMCIGSPRVCGDVSAASTLYVSPTAFSPRMRGCFHRRFDHASPFVVLPAYAGMFPTPMWHGA